MEGGGGLGGGAGAMGMLPPSKIIGVGLSRPSRPTPLSTHMRFVETLEKVMVVPTHLNPSEYI